MSGSAASPAGEGATATGRGTRGVFAVTAVGALMVSMDVSIANSLLPAIGQDFPGAGRAAVSWVITGYAIVFAAALVPAGRLADRAGRRRTYLGGLAVFGVGSLLCGVTPGLGLLLVGRAVQGLGAAAASPASLGLLLAGTDAQHRSLYAARWTGAAALGVCLGPLVGGALTTAGDWRWAFLVNLPLVVTVSLAAPRVLPETPRHPGRRLPDPWGAVTLALAAAAVTLALSEATTWGVTSVRTVGSLLLGLGLAVAFTRRSTRVGDPLLDIALLRHRRVAVAALTTGLYAAGFFAFLLTFMLFFVDHWGLSLVEAGAAVLPTGFVVVALTTRVGRLADLTGYRLPLTVGAGTMAAGLAGSALWIGGSHFSARWLGLGVFLGVGIGLCYPLLAAAAVHGLASADLAAATAINQSARQLGAALGVAAAVGVLGPAANPTLARFHAAWLVAAAFCLVAAGAAAFVPRDQKHTGPPQPREVLTRIPTHHPAEIEECSA